MHLGKKLIMQPWVVNPKKKKSLSLHQSLLLTNEFKDYQDNVVFCKVLPEKTQE